jgi:hypothetical protein
MGGSVGRDYAASRRGTRDASALFDRMLGLTRRRQVDDTIAVLRAAIRKRLGPDASEEEEGWRLSMFVWGAKWRSSSGR